MHGRAFSALPGTGTMPLLCIHPPAVNLNVAATTLVGLPEPAMDSADIITGRDENPTSTMARAAPDDRKPFQSDAPAGTA